MFLTSVHSLKLPTPMQVRVLPLAPKNNIKMSSPEKMPKYLCHKEVWAVKIKGIRRLKDGSATIVPEESGFTPFKVDQSYVKKHDPKLGGYFVLYEDGYKSFSPAEPFEAGYARKLDYIPIDQWKLSRIDHIYDAIYRYRQAGKRVPFEWVDELRNLEKETQRY